MVTLELCEFLPGVIFHTRVIYINFQLEKKLRAKINPYRGPKITAAMKRLDAESYTVVKSGQICELSTPCRMEQLVQIMEKNESYIFWLQPKHTEDITSQIPCISINGHFYDISAKLEKAVFRHIRLTRNFENKETLEDGTKKLRIPMRLLLEKKKTSQRYIVRNNTQTHNHCQCRACVVS